MPILITEPDVGEAKLDIYQPIKFDGIGALPAIDTIRFGTTTQVAGLMQKIQFRVKDTSLMLGAKQVLAVSSVDLNFYGKLGQAIDKISQHLNLGELDRASVTSIFHSVPLGTWRLVLTIRTFPATML